MNKAKIDLGKEASQIIKELEETCSCLIVLEETVGELEDRLNGVLLQPEPQKTEDESRPNLVPIADSVYGIRYRVHGQTDKIKDILDRLEL